MFILAKEYALFKMTNIYNNIGTNEKDKNIEFINLIINEGKKQLDSYI